MALRRVSLSVVVVLLASVSLVASTGPEPTRLRVEITGLPPDVAAHVGIVGPDGVDYTITTTDERPVSPGAYRVKIGSVKGSGITFHPADDQYEVVVKPERTTMTAAPYRVAIPDTTEVLDPDDPTIVRVRDLEIVFTAKSPQAADLQPGDHLISGEGERVPHLLVRRIAAVTPRGDEIVVDTEPATFDAALPAGVVRFDTVEGLTILRPASFTPDAKPDPLVEFNHSLNLEEDHGCTRGEVSPGESEDGRLPGERRTVGNIQYRLDDIDLELDGEFSWDGIVRPTVSVSAGATLTVKESVEAKFEMALRCAVTAERKVGLGCESVLARIVRIGPIRLGCEFKIAGEAFVESKGSWRTAAIETQTSLGFEVGYRSNEGGFHGDRFLTSKETREAPAIPEVEVSFGASAQFQAELTGQDPVGVAKLAIALNIKAGPTLISNLTEFRGDFKAAPTVEFSARLGRGFLKWKDTAKIDLPAVEVNLWRIARPAPEPSASLSPTSPSPTMSAEEQLSQAQQQKAFEEWYTARYLNAARSWGGELDDLDFQVLVIDDLNDDTLIDFVVVDRTPGYCGSGGCWTTTYLTRSLGNYDDVAMFGSADAMPGAMVATRPGRDGFKEIIATEQFVSHEPLYSVYVMGREGYTHSHWEYCGGNAFEMCEPVEIAPLQPGHGLEVAPGTVVRERPDHGAQSITVGSGEGVPYSGVEHPHPPVGVLLDGEWYLLDVWKGFSGFVPASAVTR
ncbi:hypothetical protein [Polymorphospora sp. NPDC050346]|uniref:hypothetical protein n=1 Tax=Polymorphospora sp. NPDC050346 TaxID=3155780 RepID=UPI0033EC032D